MNKTFFLISLLFLNKNLNALNNGSLPFVISDSRSKQAVVSATVCIEACQKCKISDVHGEGVIDSITPGLYSVTVVASGYDTLREHNILVKSGINNTLALCIGQSIQKLTKITVTGHSLASKKPSQSTSVTRFSSYELSNTPGTANDINRVLGSHPSVVRGGTDFDNTLYVRGGHSCENVFIVDGIEFENTSHFAIVAQSGGSVGFINSALVRDLEFYTGGFPARMPPRISSVIKANLRNGSMNTFKMQTDLNMSGLGLVLESPLPHIKGSWIANARFLDLRMLKPFITLGGMPRFGDGFLKLNFMPSEYSTVTATAVTSMDTYNEDDFLYSYSVHANHKEGIRQYGGILSWDYNKNTIGNTLSISGTRVDRYSYNDALNFSGRILIDSAVLNISEYRRNRQKVDTLVFATDTMQLYKCSYEKKRLNGEGDRRWVMSLKDDISLPLGDFNRISIGMNADYRRYIISNENSMYDEHILNFNRNGKSDTIINRQMKPWFSDSILNIVSGGGYAEHVLENGFFKAVTGIRCDYYNVITAYGISPRLGLCFGDLSSGVLSLSAGLYYQFPADFNGLIRNLLVNDPNSGITGGVPLGEARLQRNWQTVLGYERTIGNKYLLSFESYFKWYDREYPFIIPGKRQYYSTVFNNSTQKEELHWKLSNSEGKKRSYGIELIFQKKQYDNFYYSGALSLFTIENKYVDGKWYNDEMNVGQVLNLSVGTNFLKHHGFALRAQLSNGRRYTPVIYNQSAQGYILDYDAKYYSEQLPVNVSVNLRYSFKHFVSWGNITGYIEVMNLLNYTPVIERYYDFNSKNGFSDFECNGIIPVAGFTVDF